MSPQSLLNKWHPSMFPNRVDIYDQLFSHDPAAGRRPSASPRLLASGVPCSVQDASPLQRADYVARGALAPVMVSLPSDPGPAVLEDYMLVQTDVSPNRTLLVTALAHPGGDGVFVEITCEERQAR